MNKRVVFVASPIMDIDESGEWVPTMQDADRESPQLGVYLLAGALKNDGWDVEIVDWVSRPQSSPSDISDLIANYEVGLFSANSMNWASALSIARLARKKNPDLRTCIGGPHPTHYPESVISSKAFDCYFRGEADVFVSTIAEALLADKRPIIRIPGLGWCSDGMNKIPSTHTESDLSAINWNPLYERVPENTFLVLPVETSRGCKFQCSFCSIPQKKNWRSYSDIVGTKNIRTANSYSNKAKTGIISIVDDTFTTDHGRIIRICDDLDAEEFRNRLMYDATLVDVRNNEVIRNLAPFTSDLLIGAEVSSKEDGKRLRKASNPRLIFEAAEVLQKYGIAHRAVFSFIIGFPWHEKKDCLRTVRLAKDLAMDYGARIYIQWYWPMPGSDIWQTLEAKNLVSMEMMDVPGFFRRKEWFYPIRKLSVDDIRDIDDRIMSVQGLLDICGTDRRYRPIEYGSPIKMWGKQRINRNPSLVQSASLA